MHCSDLEALPGSLGEAPTLLPQAGDLETWFSHAEGRPAFELWGKAHEGQPWPAHPLLCHMLDVAAVAARLLTRILPQALVHRLLSIHPDRERALRLLLLIVCLHDLGKATPPFQAKAKPMLEKLLALGFDAQLDARVDRHHGDIGLLPVREVLVGLGFSSEGALRLSRAVTAHHGQFPTNQPNIRDPGPRQMGQSPRWRQARQQLVQQLLALLGLDGAHTQPTAEEGIDHAFVMLLAGLTSVADWIGSMDEVFTYQAPPASLRAYWSLALDRADQALKRAGIQPGQRRIPRTFSELFPALTPWPLHLEAEKLARAIKEPSLLIVEAPMGEGKTEAALFLSEINTTQAGLLGFYIGLPTQATANQMLGRVQTFLEATRPGESVNLLLAHGEASLVQRFEKLRLAAIYDQGGSGSLHPDDRGAVRAEGWFLSKKRTLLAEHAVGTVDQALLSVMRVPHLFVRLYGLAGKTIVLDEIHAYDTYTSTLLDHLLGWLAALGSSVILLSATLPRHRREALCQAYAEGQGHHPEKPEETPYPRITFTSGQASEARTFAPRGASVPMALEWTTPDVATIVGQALEAIEQGGCAGCIFNTVARAQEAFDLVKKNRPDLEHRLLLHARLLPDDRNRREGTLESWLGPEHRTKERPRHSIVVGTQVLEQSLDIDFDVLFTDIAPVDLVLQRSGRLFRHRRTNRSPRHTRPRLVIARPESDKQQDLDDLAGIYAPLLVRRTLDILSGRGQIVLPDDISVLVEEVYDARVIPPPSDPLYDVFLAHYGAVVSQEQQAMQKLIPAPSFEDDPFGDLKVFLDEDEDPLLHQQLRAATRLGPPTVDIVCLERLPSGALSLGDGQVFDLDAEPDRATTSRLARRTIGVSRKSVVHALTAVPAPKSWQKSALLRYRRPLIFESGRAVVGSTELLLDHDLGLVFVSSPRPRRKESA